MDRTHPDSGSITVPYDTLTSIQEWHQAARPKPTDAELQVQVGCHLEEIVEMLDTIDLWPEYGDPEDLEQAQIDAMNSLRRLAEKLKCLDAGVHIRNRRALLDSLADQIVTAVGVGWCAGMDVPKAAMRVDESNWSKFVDGKPVFHLGGKIAKGPDYHEPNLEGLY